MAYDNRSRSTRRSRQSSSGGNYRRRRQHQSFRFDYIFLGAVALVVLLVILFPRQQIPASPTVPNVPTTEPQVTDPTEPDPLPTVVFDPKPLDFTAADADLVYSRTVCEGQADVVSALQRTLDWDLTDPNFTVLIIHSHLSESYTLDSTQVPEETGAFRTDPYRTNDDRYNMVAIGEKLAQILRSFGIRVIHDTTSFEEPNSDYAYENARTYLENLLASDPSIGLVLDLHRDAVENSDGSQWAPTVTVDGLPVAQFSMVIGYGGQYDALWDQNLTFASMLAARMNQKAGGSFRQLLVNSNSYCYNQDLGPVTMLIEVGTAGNSLDEALNAAEFLGHALGDLALGANPVEAE